MVDPNLKTTLAEVETQLGVLPPSADAAIADLKAELASLNARLAADAASVDWKSAIPFIVIGLKAAAAAATDPVARGILGVVAFALGKFVPAPAPTA